MPEEFLDRRHHEIDMADVYKEDRATSSACTNIANIAYDPVQAQEH
jgi:hypothetical protein